MIFRAIEDLVVPSMKLFSRGKSNFFLASMAEHVGHFRPI